MEKTTKKTKKSVSAEETTTVAKKPATKKTVKKEADAAPKKEKTVAKKATAKKVATPTPVEPETTAVATQEVETPTTHEPRMVVQPKKIEQPKVEAVMPKTAVTVQPKSAPVKSSSKPAVNLLHGVGRRKSATARVWLKRGRGSLVINDLDYNKYFTTDDARLRASHPFRVVTQANNYDAIVNVYGGGNNAQADAVKVGIARALTQINEEWRPLLRQAGLLTVDARRKERKKYGRKAARRRFQFVKR